MPSLCGANSTLGIAEFLVALQSSSGWPRKYHVSGLDSLPLLDFRCLSDEQLLMAEVIFEEFRDKDCLPAYLADADPNRALLDRRVICDLLGFGEDIYQAVRRLSAKWCAEPSVHLVRICTLYQVNPQTSTLVIWSNGLCDSLCEGEESPNVIDSIESLIEAVTQLVNWPTMPFIVIEEAYS